MPKLKRVKDPGTGEWRDPEYDEDGGCVDCAKAHGKDGVTRREFMGMAPLPFFAVALLSGGTLAAALTGCTGFSGWRYHCLTLKSWCDQCVCTSGPRLLACADCYNQCYYTQTDGWRQCCCTPNSYYYILGDLRYCWRSAYCTEFNSGATTGQHC
jgi:hypothetical protein